MVLDSLALRYGSIVATIESVTGRAIRGVQIVGGGSRNAYLNQATATVTGLPVLAGPVEATVIGNIIVQAIAAGALPRSPRRASTSREHRAGAVRSEADRAMDRRARAISGDRSRGWVVDTDSAKCEVPSAKWSG